MSYDIEQSHVLCSPQFTYLWSKGIELNDFKGFFSLQFCQFTLYIGRTNDLEWWMEKFREMDENDLEKKNVVEG